MTTNPKNLVIEAPIEVKEINLMASKTEKAKNIKQTYQKFADNLRGDRNNRFLKTIISQNQYEDDDEGT